MMTIATSLRPLLRKQSDESESENGENKAIKSNDDCCHLAAPIIEKTARKMFQAVKRPRSWNGVRSAMYACAKSINMSAQKKCMPPQENVYTHVCAKEMYACAKSIYRYMYAQKKCMPPQENVYIHVCTKKNLCLRNNKCIHTCLHKKKCMPAHE